MITEPATVDAYTLGIQAFQKYYNDDDTWEDFQFYMKEQDTDLKTTLAEDISDLLHNGNQEELWDLANESDGELLASRLEDEDELFDEVCSVIATLITYHHYKKTN